MLTSLPPLSLYVHIPWCIKKCPYCDFNSHQIKEVSTKPELKNGAKSHVIDIQPANQGFDEKRYLEALRLD
jgi:oxygen-independent coproporphyrinogen-3 oxidase